MNDKQKIGPVERNARLSAGSLTILLILLATVPSVATVGFFYMMPGTNEGQLPVRFAIHGMPGADYYEQPADKREPLPQATIVLKNESEEPWRNIYVEINHRFEIRDMKRVIQPGEIVNFDLNKFYEKRSSVAYPPTLMPIEHIRIFAKVGESSRESWMTKISWDDLGKEIVNSPKATEKKKTEPNEK